MGEIADILATVPTESWVLFGWGAFAATAAMLWPQARCAYLQWRLERRLAREGFMFRDEANERRLAIGEEPPPLNAWQVPTVALVSGLAAAVPPWLTSLGHPDLWHIILVATEGVVILVALWRRLNDPEPKPLWPNVHFPQEAIVGFASALAIVAVLLALMFEFF